MSEINSIRVKNLRSLTDTEFIDLKPLTILVGRNSAGKSTFARILPLLRQTAEVRKRSPILWWGRLVDFGSFSESVNHSCESKEIEFSFRVRLDKFEAKDRKSYRNTSGTLDSRELEVSLSLKEASAGKESILQKINIVRDADIFTIDFEDGDQVSQIKVNKYTWTPKSTFKQEIQFATLLPTIAFYQTRTIKRNDEEIQTVFRTDPLRNALFEYFFAKNLVHGNTSFESIQELCSQFTADKPEELLVQMRNAGALLPSWAATVASLTVSSPHFINIRNLLLASEIELLLQEIDEALVNTASRCTYIEPLRATAERYYRKQGLAVAEVDSKGSNVPFFLDSLSQTERERFNQWMTTHLQAGIRISSDGGHLSIKLKDTSGIEMNLADVGFGFSQVLPVALQLWSASTRSSRQGLRRRLARATVVIEQPELHLHPEYQAKIADLLKSTIDSGSVSIIVETHSPSIINRLGILVAAGEINKDDVQIFRFDKESDSNNTTIARSEFDARGVLDNWPYGFFDA